VRPTTPVRYKVLPDALMPAVTELRDLNAMGAEGSTGDATVGAGVSQGRDAAQRTSPPSEMIEDESSATLGSSDDASTLMSSSAPGTMAACAGARIRLLRCLLPDDFVASERVPAADDFEYEVELHDGRIQRLAKAQVCRQSLLATADDDATWKCEQCPRLWWSQQWALICLECGTPSPVEEREMHTRKLAARQAMIAVNAKSFGGRKITLGSSELLSTAWQPANRARTQATWRRLRPPWSQRRR